jgi:hypothetical protein
MKPFALLLILLVFPGSFSPLQAQNKPALQYLTLGFWNVENLYDTLNDKWKNDEDFTPEGINRWTGDRYRKKIEHLAECIGKMGVEYNPEGLAFIGLCETENKKVVEDLAASPVLRSRNYQVAHIEGPDPRGVDPSFIYNPAYFKLKSKKVYPVRLQDSLHRTRDILMVSGELKGDPVIVLVNHWPSRRGGELRSRPARIAAAKLVRRIADSISRAEPETGIVVMGDMNDDPVYESVKKHLGTCADYRDADDSKMFNPMENLYNKGIGTLAWRDSWNLFDQIIFNRPLLTGNYKRFRFCEVRVFNKNFLRSHIGRFKGYPHRTYSGGIYTGGYSDHFPVYVVMGKQE